MKASGSGSGLRPRFFVQPPPMPESAAPRPSATVVLDEFDSHHATRVLRLRLGDRCEAVSLEGPTRLWQAVVAETGPRVVLELQGEPVLSAPETLQVALVQALPQIAKLDEVMEKGTEVGVDLFVLFPAASSPRDALEHAQRRLPRWQRAAREAAKQSRQLAVPPVHLEPGLADAAARLQGEEWHSVVLEPAAAGGLTEWLRGLDVTAPRTDRLRLALWVGPEAGWAADEVNGLVQRGCVTARLGRRILRAETAGPAAAAVLRFALHSW